MLWGKIVTSALNWTWLRWLSWRRFRCTSVPGQFRFTWGTRYRSGSAECLIWAVAGRVRILGSHLFSGAQSERYISVLCGFLTIELKVTKGQLAGTTIWHNLFSGSRCKHFFDVRFAFRVQSSTHGWSGASVHSVFSIGYQYYEFLKNAFWSLWSSDDVRTAFWFGNGGVRKCGNVRRWCSHVSSISVGVYGPSQGSHEMDDAISSWTRRSASFNAARRIVCSLFWVLQNLIAVSLLRLQLLHCPSTIRLRRKCRGYWVLETRPVCRSWSVASLKILWYSGSQILTIGLSSLQVSQFFAYRCTHKRIVHNYFNVETCPVPT